MDDLNGLEWSASSTSNYGANKVPVRGAGNYYASVPALQPTPPPGGSRTSTPLSAQGSGVGKPTTKAPATDSFANLVSFGSAKTNILTLQQQQEKLLAEKAKKEEEKRKQYEAQFGNAGFWDGQAGKAGLERNPFSAPPSAATSKISTPAAPVVSPQTSPFSAQNGESIGGINDVNDDLFAAFNADTKVDASSHYPTPTDLNGKIPSAQGRRLDLNDPAAWTKSSNDDTFGGLGDDDDPFGLGQMRQLRVSPAAASNTVVDDEDFLGDLGKPVEEIRRQRKETPPRALSSSGENERPESDDPWDKAVSELVDMGFSAENSRRALTESGAGLNVQAAVGWLLNEAHRQAKEKSQGKSGSQQLEQSRDSSTSRRPVATDRSGNDALPPWMRGERGQSQPRRDDGRSPANSDSDVAAKAATVGSNLFKTANSLWKTSQKKVQRAVADFQQDADPSQPKWMRDVSAAERQRPREKEPLPEDPRERGRIGEPSTPSVTDEALMLELGSGPPPKRSTRATPQIQASSSASSSSSRDHSPAISNPASGVSTPLPKWQQTAPTTALDARSRLSKQALEEQSAQAYISPARRKKATPIPKPAEKPDLSFGDLNGKRSQPVSRPEPPRANISQTMPQPARPSKPSTPIQVRPKAPTRNIPPVSPSALALSHQHRQSGTTHFKRGDYASAHSSYTQSLSSIPHGHPIMIIILCNRSLTALKTGNPKGAISDADTALSLIGPSRGVNEVIDLQDPSAADSKKDMKEFYGKALMRKAEALEEMERWADAAAVWRQAVEVGAGGATSIQGRQRCEQALAPKAPPKAPTPRPRTTPPARAMPQKDSDAVARMRAANAAAEKADDEKFALSDSVDARIGAWRDGRRDNLRALLGGLDNVLWEGSGWKKVGMHELVMNGKVKINYMKAIAKVHPDKVCDISTL